VFSRYNIVGESDIRDAARKIEQGAKAVIQSSFIVAQEQGNDDGKGNARKPEESISWLEARSGGTGRRAGLKIQWYLVPCGFDPLLRDHLSLLQNDCLRIADSPPCLYVVGLKAQIARRMAGLLIRRLFDTFPRSTEILDGLAVRSSEEIIRGAAEHKLECSFVAFCRSNVKRGQAIQQIDLPEVARVRNSDLRKGKYTRASIVFQPKLRALAAGKSPFITSSEDRPRA
jgi:hypothetical protein